MNFCLKRTLAICLLWISLPACALEVRYGPFFSVGDIRLEQGRVVLPRTRKKYANVRILDEQTYRWLTACPTQVCAQPDATGQTQVYSLRAAKTRPGMWLAQVAVDQRWLLTFLIFENEADFGVVVPQEINITHDLWRKQIEQQITDAINRLKQEGKDEM